MSHGDSILHVELNACRMPVKSLDSNSLLRKLLQGCPGFMPHNQAKSFFTPVTCTILYSSRGSKDIFKCFLKITGMERLFVIVCALGVISVGSEKSEQSVDLKDYNQNYINWHYVQREKDNRIDELPVNRAYDRQTEQEAEYEIYRLLSNTGGPVDMVKLNALGDRLISQADVTEEARRVVRQVKKQQPGFFWSLFRIAFESVGDTVSTVQEIIKVINKAINPPPTTTVKAPSSVGSTNKTTTSSPPPFMLTAEGIATTIRRNLKGLIRLFNIEWKDAIDGSKVSIHELKKDLGKSIASSLTDNPNAY